MIDAALALIVVLAVNLVLTRAAGTYRLGKPRRSGAAWLAAGEFAKIGVFFLFAHLVWLRTGSASLLVAFIFVAAVSQMSLQIYWHLKRQK